MGNKAAIIGGGVIGGGWAARFVLGGWDVAVFDPDPETPRKLSVMLENARAALAQLSDLPLPEEGALHFTLDMREAIHSADYIQESVAERLALKQRVLADIQAHAAPGVPLGSSTSGLRPSQLQEGAREPGSIFVAHPFNPVYLLPLVEIVPGIKSSAHIIDKAKEILIGLGMFPLHLRKEIDEAIRMGFGLRWAQMGLFETYRIAGGEAGMRHFLSQFGPCLSEPWTRLTDVPAYDDALIERIAGQSDAQSGARSINELERIRDANLVGILRALKAQDWGAGRVLNEHDRARRG